MFLGIVQDRSALMWRSGRMLFAGDVCMNIMGVGDPVGFERLEEGRASQRNLPVFQSMLSSSAMPSRSPAMRRRVSEGSTTNRLPDSLSSVPGFSGNRKFRMVPTCPFQD